MTDIATRPVQSQPGVPRFNLADLMGFDPFRNFFTGGVGVAGIDVSRNDQGGYTVEIPVAGFKPDEIEVTVDDDVLSVAGKNERRQFRRSLLLPEEIDRDNIQAKVENGLLQLTLNVHPKAQPKKIQVTYSN